MNHLVISAFADELEKQAKYGKLLALGAGGLAGAAGLSALGAGVMGGEDFTDKSKAALRIARGAPRTPDANSDYIIASRKTLSDMAQSNPSNRPPLPQTKDIITKRQALPQTKDIITKRQSAAKAQWDAAQERLNEQLLDYNERNTEQLRRGSRAQPRNWQGLP